MKKIQKVSKRKCQQMGVEMALDLLHTNTELLTYKGVSYDHLDFTRDYLRISTSFVVHKSDGRVMSNGEADEGPSQIDYDYFFYPNSITAIQRYYHAGHARDCVSIHSMNMYFEVYFDNIAEARKFAELVNDWKCKNIRSYT